MSITLLAEIKAEARVLLLEQKKKNKHLTHSHALELVSIQRGFRNWRTCRAALEKASTATPIPKPKKPTEDEEVECYKDPQILLGDKLGAIEAM